MNTYLPLLILPIAYISLFLVFTFLKTINEKLDHFIFCSVCASWFGFLVFTLIFLDFPIFILNFMIGMSLAGILIYPKEGDGDVIIIGSYLALAFLLIYPLLFMDMYVKLHFLIIGVLVTLISKKLSDWATKQNKTFLSNFFLVQLCLTILGLLLTYSI